MGTLLPTVLLGALAVAGDNPPAGPSRGDVLRSAAVETFLRHQMQRRRIPGLQVAVVRHGTIVLLGAYGLANIEHSVPVTDQTVFPVHSITKAFTGVAIMQLVEAGKLDLAAPVSRYLGGLPAAWGAVTVRQLLTHSSGIPDIWDANARMIADGEEAAWAKVQTLPTEFAPGERFKYNQTNYVLLGRIIDKLSGKPFAEFIRERQFDAVGMPLTGFGDSRDVVPHISGSYWYFRNAGLARLPTDRIEHHLLDWPPSLRTAVGVNTTAEELARWVIALQKGQLLKAKTSLTTLWTPGVLNDGSSGLSGGLINGYALGWPTVSRPEHRAVAPTGGMRAALFVYPDDDLAVVILTNLIGASPQTFVDGVAGYYVPDMDASTAFGLPPAVKALRAELLKRGFDHAPQVVNEVKARDAKFQLPEEDVNAWAYRLLDRGRAKEAVEIFKLNVSLYPKSRNTYDSLAEAYEAVGDRASAVKNYRRSLGLDPKNKNAAEHLRKLEPGGAKQAVK